MSKAPSPPQPVDPFMVSKSQQQSNINSAIAQSVLNDINQVTPFGTVNYTFGTPAGNAGGAAPAAAGAGGGAPGGAPPPPGLAWANQVRQKLNLPPLVPGTPQYAEWLKSTGGGAGMGLASMGVPGAAQGGGGMAGLGGALTGGGGGWGAGGLGGGDVSAGSNGGRPAY